MKVVKTTYFQWGPKILLNLECKRINTSHQINIEKKLPEIAHEENKFIKISIPWKGHNLPNVPLLHF